MFHIAKPLVLMLACIALPSAVPAQDMPAMTQIEQAWDRGDFVFAREGLEQLARQEGTPLAQYRYGRILLEGRGGPRDVDGAVSWLERAVAQNHPGAATLLARVYLTEFTQDVGVATRHDPARAAELLSMAAALGEAEAQFQLASLYSAGTGVAQDARTAFVWLLAAAKQEHVGAQYTLASVYSKGLGVAPDAEQAIGWLEKAANNNHLHAQYFLARAYETGNGVTASPETAAGWYQRAAEGGLPIAQRSLGGLYLNGTGVAQNTDEALRWLQAAAAAGDPGAMANLGRAYYQGLGVGQDDAQAAAWFSKASEYGLGRAMVALAVMHEAGRGVDLDFDRAIALYQRALDTPDAAAAARRLGQLASAGQLDERFAPHRMVPWVREAFQSADPQAEAWLMARAAEGLRPAQAALADLFLELPERAGEGAVFLEQAARAGDPDAQLQLAQLHMTGDHVALDYIAAHAWFNIAATLGRAEAADLRETATALMTPDQVAEAQAMARRWFAEEQPLPPGPDGRVTRQ